MLYSQCIFAFLDNRLTAALIRTKSLAVLLLIGVNWGDGLAAELTGRVVSVPDGDTITIQTSDRTRHRIRLDGVDAPERTQLYSQISRKNLAAMIDSQQVTVTSSKADRFGRMVGIVSTNQYSDVGLEQIKAGLAWHFKRYVRRHSALSTSLQDIG